MADFFSSSLHNLKPTLSQFSTYMETSQLQSKSIDWPESNWKIGWGCLDSTSFFSNNTEIYVVLIFLIRGNNFQVNEMIYEIKFALLKNHT